jgi:glycine/D-amino acid oxidase-like deaminating enzyme
MRILLAHPDAQAIPGVRRARSERDLESAPADAIVGEASDPLVGRARARHPRAVAVDLRSGSDAVAVEHALRSAERAVWRSRAAEREPRELPGRRVVLVGAGIVNLMSALRLARAGCRVLVIDAGMDPRVRTGLRSQGTTHGGHDARMCSLTEATVRSPAPGGADPWADPVSAGGWLPRSVRELEPATARWVRCARGLPSWLAHGFARDIHSINVRGADLWASFRAEQPVLFEQASATDHVLHVCASDAALAELLGRHRTIGDNPRVLSRAAVARACPALRVAAAHGSIAGGFEGRGFTLRIHRFVCGLLALLEREGVECRWETAAGSVRRDDQGRPVAIETAGGLVTGDDYVISIGARASGLLAGFESAGAVRGVLGVWAELDRAPGDPAVSIKAHMGGPLADCVNAIPSARADGSPCLILGAGYMLVEREADRDGEEAGQLHAAIADRARELFPERIGGGAREHPRHCVRPFTSTGLGLFEVAETAAGGTLVITGGHGTGGFVQAPAVAEAVAETLAGQPTPMQQLHHPRRGHLDARPLERPASMSATG